MTEHVPEPQPARRENALLTLFRIRVFRRMWAAITFSSLGDWLGLLANTALAQQLTREQSGVTQGFAIAGVLLVRLAPDLLVGAFAAAIADKWDRRKTVIVGEIVAGVLYASIALGYNLVWLYVAQFVIEAAGLFIQPANQVIWVAIVPKKLLPTANQLSLISVYGTVPVAAAVFALLSTIDRLIAGDHGASSSHVNAGIVIALVLNAFTFFVSAMTVFLSRRDIEVLPQQREREASVFSLVREGVGFVWANSLIRGLYIGIIGAFAAGGLTAGVAQLWVKTLSAGTAGYAIMFGTLFTGLALGLLIGPRVLPTYTRSRVFGLAIGGAGVTLLVMSVIRNFVLADGLAALVGIFAGIAWIIGYTLIGQEVEDRLRGRTFAFVLSSVRIMLLLTIAVGPVAAGLLGSHEIPFGHRAYLRFSGPGLTLLIGGVLALAVSFYATPRSNVKLRDVARRRMLRSDLPAARDHSGLLVCVDGLEPAITGPYARLVAAAARDLGLVVRETAEPSDSVAGLRLTELLGGGTLQPQTAALLSAADRAEHVATVVRPALDAGDVVVCERYVLTSVALHAGGRDAAAGRVRSVNNWGTDGLRPDLCLVIDAVSAPDATVLALAGAPAADVDLDAAVAALRDAVTADPERNVPCEPQVPEQLPEAVVARLSRLVDARTSLLTRAPAVDPPVAEQQPATGTTADPVTR